MSKELLPIGIGLLVYLIVVIVITAVVRLKFANAPKEQPRTERDGTIVLYNRMEIKTLIASWFGALTVAFCVISIIEYVIGSMFLGTTFIVLCAVIVVLGLSLCAIFFRQSIKISGDKLIEHEFKDKVIELDRAAFYEVSGNRLTLYDKYGVPVVRIPSNLVGFDVLIDTLTERGIISAKKPFPPKQFKNSPQYKAFAQKNIGINIGGTLLIIAALLLVFSIVLVVTMPPAEPKFEMLTGKIETADQEQNKIWLVGDDDWFCINSLDRRALDKDFWTNAHKGDEITVAYYTYLGSRRDIGYIEFNGRVYLELEKVKELEQAERESMFKVFRIMVSVDAGLAVVGAIAVAVSIIMYKKKQSGLVSSEPREQTKSEE